MGPRFVLIGHPGCGKSYFAERFAAFGGTSWVDTDRLVEEGYFQETGKRYSHREIFQIVREDGFREREQRAIEHIPLSIPVIATGGGTILQESAVTLLKKRGPIVFLALGKEIWKERISRLGLPVSLSNAGTLDVIYEDRLRSYESVADETLALEGKSAQQVLQILSQLRESS